MKPLRIRSCIFKDSSRPKICVSLTKPTITCIKKVLVDLTQLEVDVIEWRLDYMNTLKNFENDLQIIRKIIKDKVLLLTFRRTTQGGQKSMDDCSYAALYKRILKCDAFDMIDIEATCKDDHKQELIQIAKKEEKKVLISYHDFQHKLNDNEVIERFTRMQKAGADLIKIAYMLKQPIDEAELEKISQHCKKVIEVNFILIGMGTFGTKFRLNCGNFGCCMSFASFHKASAPGQIPIAEMLVEMSTLY